MVRQFPLEVPIAPNIPRAQRRFEIEFITPLFGGGVTQKTHDPITVVRGTSIRGQLRFWWRATRGRGCATVAELHQKESAIWGSTKSASEVRVEVVIGSRGQSIGSVIAGNCPKYALFPFSAEQKSQAVKGIAFQLALSYPAALNEDVEAAVWAWTNFGGLGSRTRRGCGALYCCETAPRGLGASVFLDWWNAIQLKCGTGIPGTYPEWSQLGSIVCIGNSSADPVDVWRTTLARLAEFRQSIPFARRPGPGRSKWPEADSLRAHTGRGSASHMASATLQNPLNEPGFPRAMLGLPIVFHFRDQDDQSWNGGTLEPLSGQRMASSFILRPLKAGDGQVAGIALPLRAPSPSDLKFCFPEDPHLPTRPPWTIPGGQTAYLRPDLASYPSSPLAGISKSGNAAVGLLTFLKNHGANLIAATKGV